MILLECYDLFGGFLGKQQVSGKADQSHVDLFKDCNIIELSFYTFCLSTQDYKLHI